MNSTNSSSEVDPIKQYQKTVGPINPQMVRLVQTYCALPEFRAALTAAMEAGKPMDFNAFAQQLPAIFEGTQVPSA